MSAAVIPLPQPPVEQSSRPVRRKATSSPHAQLVFASAPAFYAACWFAAGDLLFHTFYEPPPVVLLIFVLSAVTALGASRKALRLTLLPTAIAWAAAGLLCAEIYPAPDPQAALLASATGSAVTLQGEVVRANPARSTESTAPFSSRSSQEQSQTIDLRVQSISELHHASQAVAGGVRITLYSNPAERPRDFLCGDRLQAELSLHRPERYNDPGVWDASAYLLEQGIGAIASAKASAVVLLPGPRQASFACRVKALQQSASARVMSLTTLVPASSYTAFFRLNSEDASMVAAMITGDRTWLERRTRISFEQTGSFHLLVVSGLHLAIFAGIVFWLAHRLHLSPVWASLVTIGLAFAYAVFTGFGQPVQRSFWMVTLYLLGRLFWRERSPVNAIGFASLCLLTSNPASLFDAGFQMTLLSVLAIAGIAAPLAEQTFAPYLRATRRLSLIAIDASLPPAIAQFRVCLRLLAVHLSPWMGTRWAIAMPAALIRQLLRILELLLVSLTVELIMSMPMALYFHRLTALALPVNFLMVPFLALLLPVAFLTFVALLVSAKLAIVPAMLTAGLLHSVTGLVRIAARLPAGNFRVPGPSTQSIVLFVVLLGACLVFARRRYFAVPLSITALGLMAVAALWPRQVEHQKGSLEITAIDVGQGDSLLVVSPEGKTLLVDAGGSPFGPPPELARFDIGEEVVSAYLWSRGIERLDAVALTHAHADHIGGMASVLANFRPREVWIGNNPQSTAYDAFLHDSASAGAALHRHFAGERFAFGSTEVEVLAPDRNYQPGPAPSNNDSLVLHIQYGQTSALLEGDAEAPSEARMLAAGHLHADVLKVGHHGSRSSTTAPFLAAVRPSWSLVSVGGRNLYGHPRIEVLRELQAGHVRTFRTDTFGAATLLLNGRSVETPACFLFQNGGTQTGTKERSTHHIFSCPKCVFSVYDSLKATVTEPRASGLTASW